MKTEEYNIIWLQDKDVDEEVTLCRDKIDDDYTKYIKASHIVKLIVDKIEKEVKEKEKNTIKKRRDYGIVERKKWETYYDGRVKILTELKSKIGE